jgi:hypothetical protein
MLFDVVLGIDFELRTTGAIGVNEDEFADFLDNGRHAAGQDDESTRDSAVRFRNLLADDAVWAEPSPTGADELLAAIEAESGGTGAVMAPTARPRPSARAGRRLMLVAAAAAIVILAGLAGILVRSGGDDGGQEFAVAGT